MTYLILAQSEVTARALGAWLELLGERPVEDPHKDERCIVQELSAIGGDEAPILAYEKVVARIVKAAGDGEGILPLNEVVVLVDSVDPGHLDPVQEGSSWDGFLALLILTFPEIRWAFGVLSKPESEDVQWEWHKLPSLLSRPRRDPIFDPSGLREWVRRSARERKNGAGCPHLPKREARAAAMDEEKSYAYFHGYAAYRFGYRADVVTSWSLAESLLGPAKTEPKDPKGHGYHVLLEDMSLNFPDRASRTHLLRLGAYEDAGIPQGRAHHLSKLDSATVAENSALRALVTSGQGTRSNADVLNENRRYLRQHKRLPDRGLVILKPAGGLFALWREARLLRRTPGCRRPGDAEGFLWPPKPADLEDGDANEHGASGHGAPGRLMLVAQHLLSRAERIHEATTHVLQDVQGAVLATDALELLGGRTPTLSAQTLILKHLLEVEAECHFSGVEYHFEVRPRADELELEAKELASWFDWRERENARLNILMTCANRLAGLLSDQNQFDEEQFWMNKARRWHNSLWMRARPWRLAYWPFLRYGELLLSSFQTFCLFIGIWIGGLTAAFALVRPSALTRGVAPEGDLQTFGQAMSSFFGNNTFESGHPAWITLSVIAVLSGFAHLGILISHLYSIITRK